MHLVMLALPFVLRGLIMPELKAIRSRIEEEGVENADWDIHLQDPIDSIYKVIIVFMEWYRVIQMPEIPIKLLVESNFMSAELIETLKSVFPDRDGKVSGWKVGKCHDVLHVAENIAMFGWTQNTSGEWGEHSHVVNIKCLMGLINNKDIFLQFAKWHQRAGMLQRDEDSHSDGSKSESESDLDQDSSADDHGAKKTGKKKRSYAENPPCELAVRYPLLHAAIHFKELIYTIGSYGPHQDGRYCLDIWSLPADRVPQLDLAIKHPAITAIPALLGVFAYEFMQKHLGLRRTGEPTVTQVNKVLKDNMSGNALLKTFGVLSLKLPGCQGVQRIRSYPFGPDDMFHGKNCRPTVFVIPPKQFNRRKASYQNFEFNGLHHANRLWVGRVELLFTCTFSAQPDGHDIHCELALISFLYSFNVPAAMGPLQRKAGCTMYYDPAPNHWYRIVPVRHIIGRS